jgi:glyoxylase-like metal-dependent hydrolase (beta-lactamase superfamily II)
VCPGIELFPVPGHSPGCQAVLVETPGGKVCISGFCSIAENFYPPEDIQLKVSPFACSSVIIPGICADPLKVFESVLKVKSSADVIVPLHDYEMALKRSITAEFVKERRPTNA